MKPRRREPRTEYATKFKVVKRLALFLVPAALALLALLFPALATAANPLLINFQGKVVNANGTNVTDGSYSFTFKLYTVSSAGTAVWTETKNLSVANGIFQTELGDTTSLSSIDFNANPNLYLGITFNNDAAGEMTPRVHLDSVPYAFNADKLGGLSAGQYVQLSPGAQQTGGINISGNIQTAGVLTVQGTSASAFSGPITITTATTGNGISVTQSGNPTSGNALIVANNTNAAPSGNLISLQANGTSEFSVDAGGNVINAGVLTVQGTATSNFSGSIAITNNTAASTSVNVGNSGAANSAYLQAGAQNGSTYFGSAGSTYSTVAILQNSGFAYSGLPGGLVLATASAAPILFGINNVEVARFDSSGNLLLAAGKNLTFAAGAGNFDQSASTGTFATASGSNSLNGNTTIAAGKTLTVNGAATVQPTFNPTGGGTQKALSITLTNAPTGVANTAIGSQISVSDATALANTLQGLGISVSDTGTGAKAVTGLLVDTTGTTNASATVTTALFKTKNSATAFIIQNGSGVSALTADTTTNTITIANLAVTGTLRLGNSTTPGYVLTGDTNGYATWQQLPVSTVYNNSGTTTSGMKVWSGSATTSGGTVTINVTSDGTATGAALFTNIWGAQVSTLSNSAPPGVPLASIKTITSNKSFLINVVMGQNIGILGAASEIANTSSATVYLTVYGN